MYRSLTPMGSWRRAIPTGRSAHPNDSKPQKEGFHGSGSVDRRVDLDILALWMRARCKNLEDWGQTRPQYLQLLTHKSTMQRSTLERARTGLVKSGQSAFLYLCWCACNVLAVLGSRMFDGCSDPMHVVVVGNSNSALRRILFRPNLLHLHRHQMGPTCAKMQEFVVMQPYAGTMCAVTNLRISDATAC